MADESPGSEASGFYDVMPEPMARKFKNLGPDRIRECGKCGGRHGCPFCLDDGLLVAYQDADRVDQYGPCPFCQHGHAIEFGVWPTPKLTRDRRPKVEDGEVVWSLHREARPPWGSRGFWRDKDLSQLERRCGVVSWEEYRMEAAAFAVERGLQAGFEAVDAMFGRRG